MNKHTSGIMIRESTIAIEKASWRLNFIQMTSYGYPFDIVCPLEGGGVRLNVAARLRWCRTAGAMKDTSAPGESELSYAPGVKALDWRGDRRCIHL